MRLGQLSRKVSARPQEILEFLASIGVNIEDSSNAKIEDSDALSVIQRFAPHLYEAESNEVEVSPETVGSEKDVEPEETIANFGETVAEEKIEEDKADDSEEQKPNESFEQEPMFIKAPKVELQGLRILGKIELPEPKKKEPPVVEEKPTHQEAASKSVTRESGRNFERKFSRKSFKNPVAQERERKARENDEKKLQKIEAEKERRKQYYANRVKPVIPVKSVKLIDEPLGTLSDEAPEAPKGIIRKFIHWLTTY